MAELHVWHNDCDWVIATDAEDARKVCAESCGMLLTDVDPDEWEQWPNDRTLTIVEEDPTRKTVKTCGGWIAEHGRGFLCSTEY
jgi:hypothetical protein